METNNNQLFSEFPPVSTEAWKELIIKDLKGEDFEKKLSWKTEEGFSVQPFYRKEDIENLAVMDTLPGCFPYVRGVKQEGNAWEIRQEIPVLNIQEANAEAKNALLRGCGEITFVIQSEIIASQPDFEALLRGIDLEKNAVHFQAGSSGADIISMLSNYVSKLGMNPAKIQGSTDFDPLRYLSIHGHFYFKEEERAFERVKRLVSFSKENLPNFKPLGVNGYIFREAGATPVQELAFSLSVASEYMAKLTERSIPAEMAAESIHFTFGVGSSYFMEIAKIRAARFLWAKIAEVFCSGNPDAAKMYIHSKSLLWNKTLYDANVNMLRNTTEAISAILGGTDSLALCPHDFYAEKSSPLAARLTRNIQLVLKEEAYLDKVADPAAGSYYIETLTQKLIEASWKLFLDIDNKGGYVKAFRENYVQDMVEETASKRLEEVSQRKNTILGTNQYPNFNEKMLQAVRYNDIFAEAQTSSEVIGKPIRMFRQAIALEQLRLDTEKSGKRPLAFMFTYGNMAMRRARSQFASNFFACAGFEVKDNNGFTDLSEGVKAAIDAKADIVVICSSDEEYAGIAPEVFAQLKDKAIVVVAGNPKNCIDDLKKHGIEHFIHVRSNLLETLRTFQKSLRII